MIHRNMLPLIELCYKLLFYCLKDMEIELGSPAKDPSVVSAEKSPPIVHLTALPDANKEDAHQVLNDTHCDHFAKKSLPK